MMRLYIAQLFAFAGMLAGRIARAKGSEWGQEYIEWAPIAKDARQAGQAFVDAGRGAGPPRQWPRAPGRPRSGYNPPPVEKAERPIPTPVAPFPETR